MDSETAIGLKNIYAMAVSGIGAGVHVLRLMASRGLVSPAEVEEYADSVFVAFDVPESDPTHPHLARLRDDLEGAFAPAFAEIREYAKSRWVGRNQPPTG